MILSNFTDRKTSLRTYFLPYLVSHFIIFVEIMEKLTVGSFINKMPLPDKKNVNTNAKYGNVYKEN